MNERATCRNHRTNNDLDYGAYEIVFSGSVQLKNSRHLLKDYWANSLGLAIAKWSARRFEMNFKYLKSKIGGVLLGATLVMGIGMVSTANAQGQWPWGQDRGYRRDRDYRNDRYGRGNYGYQIARDRGYQDGLQTGASDGQKGQNYNPQRSHFFRNAT